VHLPDRRGGHRHGVEVDEEALDRRAQLGRDDVLDVCVRHRRDRVLQQPQLRQDLRRDDVGSGREQLAELHERRPQLVEHLAQVTAERRQVLGLDDGCAAQRPPLEHEAETVLRGNLRNLAQAAHRPPPVRERGHRAAC
jgi:hypothetical protein